MTDTKNIGTIATEILENLEQKKRDPNNDNTYFYCLKKTIEWQQDIIRNAHNDRLPNDDIYNRIHDILECIQDIETEEQAQERLYEIEPDIYTNDLTAWLNDNINNVYYLTEALEEGMEIKDGFNLLMYAQSKYIQEIGNTLIQGIVEHLETV